MTKIQLNIMILHFITLKEQKSKALDRLSIFLTQYFNILTKQLAN